MNKETKIKTLVDAMGAVFGLAFLDGLFELGLSDDVYTLIGLVAMAITIWLLKLVHSKEVKE